MLGSIDANTGDLLLGWDTDQFNTDVKELTLAMVSILKAGGLGTGGFNFDAKLRRQSLAPNDLFSAHIGGIDTIAQALLVAAGLIEGAELKKNRDARYAGWAGELGTSILSGGITLEQLESRVGTDGIDPKPVSGKQEVLENIVNRQIWSVR